MCDFINNKSKDTLINLKIPDDFLTVSPILWNENASYIKAREFISDLKPINDVAERSVKLMQDFHGLITADEEQKQCLLQCVQEHRKLYPDCKKDTLKRKYPNE